MDLPSSRCAEGESPWWRFCDSGRRGSGRGSSGTAPYGIPVGLAGCRYCLRGRCRAGCRRESRDECCPGRVGFELTDPQLAADALWRAQRAGEDMVTDHCPAIEYRRRGG